MTDTRFVRIDHERRRRTASPEAVLAPGKTREQCVSIVREMLAHESGPVIVTRIDADDAGELTAAVPGGTYDPVARVATWRRPGHPRNEAAGVVALATAGTADIPVAAEAGATLAALGIPTDRYNDIGVAGLHRTLGVRDSIEAADVVIVVAGMDGALPTVIAGLVSTPLIAVPTSTGYGAAFEGISALLTMLAACAPGVTVVGIDNGFGAACAAQRIIEGSRRAGGPGD